MAISTSISSIPVTTPRSCSCGCFVSDQPTLVGQKSSWLVDDDDTTDIRSGVAWRDHNLVRRRPPRLCARRTSHEASSHAFHQAPVRKSIGQTSLSAGKRISKLGLAHQLWSGRTGWLVRPTYPHRGYELGGRARPEKSWLHPLSSILGFVSDEPQGKREELFSSSAIRYFEYERGMWQQVQCYRFRPARRQKHIGAWPREDSAALELFA